MNATKRRWHSEAGVTLVELLVVMVLLGVVGGVTVQGIVKALATSSTTQARIAATHEIEVALQRVTRDLRAAAPLEIHPSEDPGVWLTTFVRYDSARYRVTYALSGGQLEQVSVPVDDADEDVGPREAVLITQLDHVLGEGEIEPVFTFFRSDGTAVTCDHTDPGCRDQYLGAASIGLRLRREITGQEPVVAETRTAVRSIRYSGA